MGGEYASAALALTKQSVYLTALTGTPIPNSCLDLYNLLHILFPHEYDEFFGFSNMLLRHPTPAEAETANNRLLLQGLTFGIFAICWMTAARREK